MVWVQRALGQNPWMCAQHPKVGWGLSLANYWDPSNFYLVGALTWDPNFGLLCWKKAGDLKTRHGFLFQKGDKETIQWMCSTTKRCLYVIIWHYLGIQGNSFIPYPLFKQSFTTFSCPPREKGRKKKHNRCGFVSFFLPSPPSNGYQPFQRKQKQRNVEEKNGSVCIHIDFKQHPNLLQLSCPTLISLPTWGRKGVLFVASVSHST